jgi:hypothetical protein
VDTTGNRFPPMGKQDVGKDWASTQVVRRMHSPKKAQRRIIENIVRA